MTTITETAGWSRARSGEAGMAAQVLDGAEGFAKVQAEWLDLFGRVDRAVWSCHPEVFRIWSDLLRRRGRTRLLAVRDAAGRLRGLMPLMFDLAWRGPSGTPRFDYDPRDIGMVANRGRRVLPLRQLTTMASMPATMLWIAPLCEPADADAVVEAMAAAILRQRGWDVLVLPAFDGEDAERWVRALEARGAQPRRQALGRRVQNIAELAPFQEIVDRQNKNFRRNVRRAQAAAATAGLRFEIHVGAAAVAPLLPAVADLARASWKHEGREGAEVHIPYEGDQRAFMERLLGADAPGAEPVLALALDPEGPVDTMLLLRHGSAVTALLTFWNGRQRAASPGLLLMGRVIDWVHGSGARRFDLNATASWVRHVVDADRTVGHVVVFGRRPWGRVLGAVARWSGRLP